MLLAHNARGNETRAAPCAQRKRRAKSEEKAAMSPSSRARCARSGKRVKECARLRRAQNANAKKRTIISAKSVRACACARSLKECAARHESSARKRPARAAVFYKRVRVMRCMPRAYATPQVRARRCACASVRDVSGGSVPRRTRNSRACACMFDAQEQAGVQRGEREPPRRARCACTSARPPAAWWR